MRSTRTFASGLALAALVLAAGTGAPAEQESKADKTSCINKREINVIRALGDEHVFVKLSASRCYLLTVGKPCLDLHSARAIAIEGTRTRVCDGGSDLIVFEYPSLGPTHCRIEKIESVADLNAARELVDSRAREE